MYNSTMKLVVKNLTILWYFEVKMSPNIFQLVHQHIRNKDMYICDQENPLPSKCTW